MVHSKAFRGALRSPKLGDLVKLTGLGSLGKPFKSHHGVGVVHEIIKSLNARVQYQIKWLKSDELMTLHKEDLLIISNVD